MRQMRRTHACLRDAQIAESLRIHHPAARHALLIEHDGIEVGDFWTNGSHEYQAGARVDLGADALSFDSIVASGGNGAKPQGRTGRQRGELDARLQAQSRLAPLALLLRGRLRALTLKATLLFVAMNFAATVDGRRTAQFEHTMVVTDDGVELLTLHPDGRWSGDGGSPEA